MAEFGTSQQAEGVGEADAGTQGRADTERVTPSPTAVGERERARGYVHGGEGPQPRNASEHSVTPFPKDEGTWCLSEGEGPNSAPSTQHPAPNTRRAHRRPPKPMILLAVLAIGYLAWWLYTDFFAPPPRGIFASGTIESEEVSIASEVVGRVTQLLAEEGDTVRAGDVLVRLDDSLLQLQYRMAALAERQPLELQLDKMTIRSPIDGVVARRSIRVGEVASPGAALMIVTEPDPVELTVYVPVKEIGRVRVGQKVDVQVDSFPDEVFSGEVTFISTKAEFTPRNVQTQKDRLNLVFAVKVRIPNPNLRLKPGMPADATILY